MKRLSCSFSDKLGNKIEFMASEIGMSQSSVVSMAVQEYFDQKEMISNMPKLLKLSEDLANLDAKEAKRLLNEIGLKKD